MAVRLKLISLVISVATGYLPVPILCQITYWGKGYVRHE